MSRKLRTAMLIDTWFPFFGGGQVHVRNLRDRLENKHKVKVDLYFAGRSHLLIRLFWSLIVYFQVYWIHRRKPYDLIHSHGFIAGLPAKLLAISLRIPVVHTVHGSHLMDKNAIGPKAWLERCLLTQIPYDAQITVAHSFLKYENVNKNIVVIPNGVNISEFDEVRTRKHKTPSLIWVGREHPDKGVSYLKEAILRIRKKIPKLKTELVTGGRLTGTELIKAYKRSHVFVLPSLAEGQPITLLEAWAAKLPVVVTPVGDNPMMVNDGKNGFLVEAGNVTQLTQAILTLLRSKSKGKKMGSIGYRRVKKSYSWEKVARETYAVYESLLQ